MFNYQVLMFFVLLLCIECASRTIVEYCPPLPDKTLQLLFGSAYNPNYMSIDQPAPVQQEDSAMPNNKRASIDELEFYVDSNYRKELSDLPAWEYQHIPTSRKKRQVVKNTSIKNNAEKPSIRRDTRQLFLDSVTPQQQKNVFKSRPWECKATIKWIDLGYDYYPRYLRTVECTKKDCWYGHYTCKPKSFRVKVLRRQNGECGRVNDKLMMLASIDQKSGEFVELWKWEEMAVNFCCDCVMS